MHRTTILIIASISGAIAVGLGAFGAHGLEPMLLETGRLDTFETAVRYQFYHTLLLFGTGAISSLISARYRNATAWLVVTGMVIFSGSLYVLCLTGITWLGAITPLGGLSLIAGWLTLAAGIYAGSKKS